MVRTHSKLGNTEMVWRGRKTLPPTLRSIQRVRAMRLVTPSVTLGSRIGDLRQMVLFAKLHLYKASAWETS